MRKTRVQKAKSRIKKEEINELLTPGLKRELKIDMINHPPHYKSEAGIEAIDVIEAFNLDYHLGCAVKYILRHENKGDPLQDLKKAQWYLNRKISQMEKKNEK